MDQGGGSGISGSDKRWDFCPTHAVAELERTKAGLERTAEVKRAERAAAKEARRIERESKKAAKRAETLSTTSTGLPTGGDDGAPRVKKARRGRAADRERTGDSPH